MRDKLLVVSRQQVVLVGSGAVGVVVVVVVALLLRLLFLKVRIVGFILSHNTPMHGGRQSAYHIWSAWLLCLLVAMRVTAVLPPRIPRYLIYICHALNFFCRKAYC